VKFFITTAIDYPSTEPHLGHAYEKVCADVIARYKRLKGFEVHFSTGTDEHGLKIQRYAEAAGKTPQEFVDEMAAKFREMCEALNISYDDFIRTTEPRHERVAKEIFRKLWEAGDIYRGNYEGYYCTECETYYSEGELVEGKCPVHGKPAEWMSEESYFFRMGKYRERILEHIKSHPDFIRPPERAREILKRLEGPLRDLCVSRSTFDWGVKLPIDERHVMYVWVDALTNYLTTAGYPEGWWPADLHLIGKDISWHHCVIWPALLLSAGLPLPKQIFVHGFVTMGGEKLSKSRGVRVDPILLARKYSPDALRYFLIRHIPFGSDGEFTEEGLVRRLHDELADVLGNFAHRVLSFIHSRFGGRVPEGRMDEEMRRKILQVVEEVEKLMDELELTKALERAFSLASLGNEYFQSREPWRGGPEAGECLLTSINLLRTLCVLLYPFMPSSCTKLAEMGGFRVESWEQAKALDLAPGHQIGKPEPLFQKVARGSEEKEEISYGEFMKLDLRVAEVETAERVEGSDKLLKLTVRLGGERRTVVAGIGRRYRPEELVGKQVVLVANLEPRTIMGIPSQGMILAAGESEEEVSLLVPDRKVKSNTRVR